MKTKTKIFIGVAITATLTFVLYKAYKTYLEETGQTKQKNKEPELENYHPNEEWKKDRELILNEIKKRAKKEWLYDKGDTLYEPFEEEITKEISKKIDEEQFSLINDICDSTITEKEEEKKEEVRYHPESKEALEEYKDTILSVLPVDPYYYVMEKLFNIQFIPRNKLDLIVHAHLAENKEDYFGHFPAVTNSVSYAELLLYFAEKADYEIDLDKHAFICRIIDKLDLLNKNQTELETILLKCANHEFLLEEPQVFSIFALGYLDSPYEEISAYIDPVYGYEGFETEFNVLIDQLLGDE